MVTTDIKEETVVHSDLHKWTHGQLDVYTVSPHKILIDYRGNKGKVWKTPFSVSDQKEYDHREYDHYWGELNLFSNW